MYSKGKHVAKSLFKFKCILKVLFIMVIPKIQVNSQTDITFFTEIFWFLLHFVERKYKAPPASFTWFLTAAIWIWWNWFWKMTFNKMQWISERWTIRTWFCWDNSWIFAKNCQTSFSVNFRAVVLFSVLLAII